MSIRVFACRLAVVVDEDVAHYRHHPSFEIRVIDKLFLIVQSLQRGVLDEVMGLVAVKGKLHRERKKISLHAQKGALEGVLGCHFCC